MKERRVLLIGPFPPVIGGDTVSTLRLFRSRYWRACNIKVVRINTSAGDRIRLPDERLSVRDLSRAVRILSNAMVRIPRFDAVLLWANSRFVCTVGLVIIVVSAFCRKPVIVKLFGTSLVERIHRFRRLWQKLAVYVMRAPRCILPQTKAFTDWLVKDLRLSPSQVRCFPNFIPDEAFHEQYAKKRFSGNCVFVGQVKKEKGVFDIIGAFKGRDELRCDFYGGIVNRDRDSFLAEIAESENLCYRGVVAPEEVCDVMGRYDALLLPTYHGGEGYPSVILEAFAAGVPVVTTRWRSIPDIVENDVRGILVPIKSPEKILSALERLASDQGLYDRIVANAFTFVRSYSEREVVRNKLIPWIEEIWAEDTR